MLATKMPAEIYLTLRAVTFNFTENIANSGLTALPIPKLIVFGPV